MSKGISQVVSFSYTGIKSMRINSTQAQDIGMSVKITPKSKNSKFFIMGSFVSSVSGLTTVFFNLYRNDIQIAMGDSAGNRQRVWIKTSAPNTSWNSSSNGTFLDIPNTKDEIEYKVKMGHHGGDRTMRLNYNFSDGDDTYGDQARAISTITIMEIGE
jgi:hypothetical protein